MGFAEGCLREANRAWERVGRFPNSYSRWKNGPSTVQRLQRGCLGWLIFGVLYLFVPLMVFVAVEAVLLSWAVVVSLVAVIAVGLGHLGRRRSQDQASA